MIIAVMFFILMTFVYLIKYGANKSKSEEERRREEQEEMEYWKQYEEQKILKKAERIKNKFCKKNEELRKRRQK